MNWNQFNATTQQTNRTQRGHKQAHNDKNQHKTYNRVGDVDHHSHKDITSTAQPKEHNATSVKSWDIFQNYVEQRCQNVPDRDHHNNHTTNPQGTIKQDVFDMCRNKVRT